jgi:ribosome-associated heat shock protein Hsp15
MKITSKMSEMTTARTVLQEISQNRSMDKLRIDKWLWAARFYKTRSLAGEEIDKGRVRVNDVEAKPAKEVKVGDVVAMRVGAVVRTVTILGISAQRGGAPAAALLFAETSESIAARERASEQRRLNPEPSAALEHGRPTKRDRRDLDKAKQGKDGWGDRWSASYEP